MSKDIITPFAKTSFRNKETVFGIKTDDRRRHMYIIGKTGMGKTNLLENLAINDIRNGHGICFIDPHGDTAEKLISMIPPSRIDDVIYFNPGDQDYPIAFNILEKVEPKYRPLVTSGVIGVFQKLWADSWGPRLEYILRNAILALLEYPNSTLLGVMKILIDKKYAADVADKVTDPIVKSFWTDEFTKWNDRVLQEVISPIQNKVGQFLTSPLIRNVIGQKESSFSVRKIMDEQKILIMNLAKGRIGEDNASLLGAMMITKIQLAAMGRVDIPNEDDRKDFYLYVDEFQNFATSSFASILSEARKYRLNLILANQYMAQLQDDVREAVFGNAGTLISFRIGAADAEIMEKEFEPVFSMNDIVNIPKFNIYLKLMIDGIAGDAFSAKVLPPIEVIHPDSTEAVIMASRQKYAKKREEVDKEIAELNTISVSSDTPTKKQNNVNNTKKTEEAREMYSAVCAMCEDEIKVPFQPDGVRKVFCKDCLKLHQKNLALKKNIEQQQKKNKNQQNEQVRKNKKTTKEIKEEASKVNEAHISLESMKFLNIMNEPKISDRSSANKINNIKKQTKQIRKENNTTITGNSIKDLIISAQNKKLD